MSTQNLTKEEVRTQIWDIAAKTMGWQNKRIPKDQQYWTMLGKSELINGQAANKELDQLLKEERATRNQIWSLGDWDRATHEFNQQHLTGVHCYMHDLITGIAQALENPDFLPAFIHYNTLTSFAKDTENTARLLALVDWWAKQTGGRTFIAASHGMGHRHEIEKTTLIEALKREDNAKIALGYGGLVKELPIRLKNYILLTVGITEG